MFANVKVGQKGQVVIPKMFRQMLGIRAGEEIRAEVEQDRVVLRRPSVDVAAIAEEIAFKGKHVGRIDSDKEYDRMMMERWKKWRI